MVFFYTAHYRFVSNLSEHVETVNIRTDILSLLTRKYGSHGLVPGSFIFVLYTGQVLHGINS